MNTLIFIPFPVMGHLIPFMELIKLFLHRHQTISITVVIMKPIFQSKQISTFIQSLSTHNNRLHFHHLQHPDQPVDSTPPTPSPVSAVFQMIPRYNQQVKHMVISSIGLSRTLGFVLDMFCTPMMDVAQQLTLPSYIYYTSGLTTLGFNLHFDHTILDTDFDTFIASNPTISIPTFPQPLPTNLLSSVLPDKTMIPFFLQRCKNFKRANGILVNSFTELEPHAAMAMEEAEIPVYPIGPIVSLDENGGGEEDGEIMKWLDLQPNGSVVFLCFGSMGSFSGDQVKEVAEGVERSGYRFLWSLRKEVKEGGMAIPGEEIGVEELPVGFLERTEGVGMVIGWAPQGAVLRHRAVGGFVTHCGWNSTLESLWCGVGMAAWPMYAEQNINAFLLVKVVGLAVEVSVEYKKGRGMVVGAEVVEQGIRKLMEEDGDVRKKVKAMKVKAVKAMSSEGSSVLALRRFVEDLTSAAGR